MKKLKPEKESPVDLDNQRGKGQFYNNESQIPPENTVVKEEKHSSSDKDWETHEAERAMWSLLRPYCLPATKIRRPLASLQLRPGVSNALVKNGSRLELCQIADAMCDSVERKGWKEARV
jgi:hypothetical protein